MSVEDLKKYGKMCAENEEARNKAKEIGMNDIDGQIAHAKSLGLEFSMDDLEALAKEIGVDQKDELSDDDLEKVAGGATTITVGALSSAAVVVVGPAPDVGSASADAW